MIRGLLVGIALVVTLTGCGGKERQFVSGGTSQRAPPGSRPSASYPWTSMGCQHVLWAPDAPAEANATRDPVQMGCAAEPRVTRSARAATRRVRRVNAP